MLTKKHYIANASSRILLIKEFAEMLSEDNPRFNKSKFLTACGIEE